MTKQTKAYLSLFFICIVWGTTFLAIRVGVMHYPAFLFAGIRQLLAGVILMTVALIANRNSDFSAKNIMRQMLIGFLMLTLGNGFVSWGEKFIPSGIAALLCAMMPLFAVLFNLASSRKDHFNMTIGGGMALGVLGVGLIFRHNIAEMTKPAYLGGIAATLFATASWAVGITINKKFPKPVNAFLNSGMQLFFGGVFMLIMSPVIDDFTGFEPWNKDALMAMAYLIVFGSALAYAAYMYTLSVLPIGIATLYAYVNPLIAVLVGYVFMKEELNIYIGMAFVAIAISVYLVNRGYRQQHKETTTDVQEAAFPESASIES